MSKRIKRTDDLTLVRTLHNQSLLFHCPYSQFERAKEYRYSKYSAKPLYNYFYVYQKYINNYINFFFNVVFNIKYFIKDTEQGHNKILKYVNQLNLPFE